MKSKLSRIYDTIKQKCNNPKDSHYEAYGAKGITICEEWNNREMVGFRSKGWLEFKAWALSHGYQEGLSIDRIDNKKGYSPENCRWVTMKVQENNRTNNFMVTYKEKTQTLMQWCNELNLNYKTIYSRLTKSHWSVNEAFEK